MRFIYTSTEVSEDYNSFTLADRQYILRHVQLNRRTLIESGGFSAADIRSPKARSG
jgi:hypothetical protein